MIKKLRYQFIAIAMCSMAAVLFLLIGGINLANYRSINRSADMRLDILSQNGGRFPRTAPANEEESGAEHFPPEEAYDPLSEAPAPPHGHSPLNRKTRSESFWGLFSDMSVNNSPETPFDTRFFTVVIRSDGAVSSVDTGKIAAVSTSQAGEYASALFNRGSVEGYVDYYKYRAVPLSGSMGEENTMYIFLDCGRELNTFRSFLFASIAASLLGLLLVFLLVLFFSRKLVRPAAESYEKQKRFITDASHELKTPLAVIEANTEVLEMEAGENEWTESIHRQIGRLSSLIQRLILLSRMEEENAGAFTMADFSLSDAVAEASEPFRAVAAAQEKTFTLDIAPGIMLRGDKAAVCQLVSLLLDNALKYAADKGSIRLTLRTEGKSKLLTLWNTAQGLTPGRQDILFDRFYRPDASRSSSTGGFGIGLSVAKAIVTAHRGKISAKSEDGRSILFTVTFL